MTEKRQCVSLLPLTLFSENRNFRAYRTFTPNANARNNDHKPSEILWFEFRHEQRKFTPLEDENDIYFQWNGGNVRWEGKLEFHLLSNLHTHITHCRLAHDDCLALDCWTFANWKHLAPVLPCSCSDVWILERAEGNVAWIQYRNASLPNTALNKKDKQTVGISECVVATAHECAKHRHSAKSTNESHAKYTVGVSEGHEQSPRHTIQNRTHVAHGIKTRKERHKPYNGYNKGMWNTLFITCFTIAKSSCARGLSLFTWQMKFTGCT